MRTYKKIICRPYQLRLVRIRPPASECHDVTGGRRLGGLWQTGRCGPLLANCHKTCAIASQRAPSAIRRYTDFIVSR